MTRPEVRRRIKVLTDFLYNQYSLSSGAINLNQIVEDEGILLHYDDYDKAFDGMFVIEKGTHHVHLNVTLGNYPNSGRGRFSLAHEIGHYMIEEHHTDIRLGKLKPHPSFQKNSQLNFYEDEADYFAANLLMPENRFYDACGGKEFSWQLIEDLSSKFHTSRFATLRRFLSIIKHEVIAIGSTNGIVKWFMLTDDFPKMKHRFKRGHPLPKSAVANKVVTGVSAVLDAENEDWFETWGGKSDRLMFEQCYYAEAYDQHITLLWFK